MIYLDLKATSNVISQAQYTIVDLHDGEDSKYVSITGLSSFHYENSNDIIPTPSSITLTANQQNIPSYSLKWQFRIVTSDTWQDIKSGPGSFIEGNTLTVNDKVCFSQNLATEFKVIVIDEETKIEYFATHTINKIYDGDNGNDGSDGEDGQDAYSCILTNEADTIVIDKNGVIKPGQIGSISCKAFSTIIAKKGIQDLTAIDQNTTPATGQYNFKFEPVPVNCTAAIKGNNSFYLDTIDTSKDNGKINITIYLEGNSNKIIKEYTWTKVIDGADARYLLIEGEDKFVYDTPSDTTSTPETITLTATAYNIENPTYKWQYYNGKMIDIVSGDGCLIDNNTLTIDDKKLFPNDAKAVKIQCLCTYREKTYSDTKSIIKTYNGEPGKPSKNVIITGVSQIRYDKNNIPNPSVIELTATPTNYSNPIYKWYYITSSEAQLISGQTTNKLSVAHNSEYFNGTDLALIRVECRESDGTSPSYYEHTIAKSYDGSDATNLVLNIVDGTRNICYNGKGDLITTVITPFKVELYEDNVNVTSNTGVRITWSCNGHYEVGSASVGAITFRPSPINKYNEDKLDTSVSVLINYNGRIIKQSAPITVSKNSTALDWIEEWDGSKVEVGGTQIISPKIFAGKKNMQTNKITGVALGQDIINKNQNIGMAIYYENNLIGRINSDPSIDNNKIIVFGSQPGKQFLVDINGEVIIEGGLKVIASSTTTTIGGIFDTVTNTNNKVDLVEERVTTAEQKITSDAITNTVKKATTVDGKPVFVQTSVIEQTEKNWTAKFESIGTQNLLVNSDFRNEINSKPFGNDYTYLRWDNSAGGRVDLQIWKDDNYWILNGTKAITVIGENFNLTNGQCNEHVRAGFDCPKFKVVPGKKYMISFKCAGHRITGITCECLCYDINGQRLPESNHATILTDIPAGGKNPNDWRTVKHSFIPQEGADFCCIRIFIDSANIDTNNGDSNTCFLWVTQLMVNEGSTWLDWTSHTSEYYMGSVDMTKDGIKVSMADGQGEQGYSLLGPEGLVVRNSNGGSIAHFGQGNSAQIGNLNVTGTLNNRQILKWAEGRPYSFYVAPQSTGNGSGFDIHNKSNSITSVLNRIWNEYGCYSWSQDMNIYIENGVYSESVYIGGWLGSGIIRLIFSPGVTFRGNITIADNMPFVILSGNKTNFNTNDGCMLHPSYIVDPISVQNSKVLINGFRSITGASVFHADSFVRCEWGSDVRINNCDIAGFNNFVYSTEGSTVRFGDNRGWINRITGGFINGVLYHTNTYRPVCDNDITDTWNSNIFFQGGATYDSLHSPKGNPTPPPAPTWNWVENSFMLQNLRSIPEGSGSGTTSRYGEWGQGKWGSYKPHRGYADLGDSPSNWCSGGRNFTVTLTMTRLNTSHGYGGAVPKPKIKEPNGNFWDSGKAFARGDTHSITLPSSIADAIVSGNMKTLEMWAGTSTNDYSFYNNATIKITCEKQI